MKKKLILSLVVTLSSLSLSAQTDSTIVFHYLLEEYIEQVGGDLNKVRFEFSAIATSVSKRYKIYHIEDITLMRTSTFYPEEKIREEIQKMLIEKISI